MTGNDILPFKIAPNYAIDLDNLWQWQYAESILEYGELVIIQPSKAAISPTIFPEKQQLNG